MRDRPRHFRGPLASCVLAASCLMAGPAGAQPGAACDAPATTILVVRHADRAGQADSLSAQGVERARDLARTARTAGVRAIYHSDTRRTRDTAAPLAGALALTPLEYPAREVTALIERILRDHPGGTVLVVGHSNTVPLIIAAAGGPTIPELGENEYDGLFVLRMTCRDRPATLTHLQYGAPSRPE